jgi:hypothetical protein
MREEIKLYTVLWESAKERDHSEERVVEGMMELECILRRLA